jgi:transcriptional regulator with XRE-family HTH domain
MNLATYLAENNISVIDFAKKIGTSRQQVYHYMAKYGTEGHCIPRQKVMERILKATNNEVSLHSFYFEAWQENKKQNHANQKRRKHEKSTGNTEVGKTQEGV